MAVAVTSEQTQEEVLPPRLLLLPVVGITEVREHVVDHLTPSESIPLCTQDAARGFLRWSGETI